MNNARLPMFNCLIEHSMTSVSFQSEIQKNEAKQFENASTALW